MLAGCVLSHIVPGMYALGGAVILTIVELLPARWGIGDSALHCRRERRDRLPVPRTRTLWWAGSTVAIGLLLSGWWLVPFGLEHAYSSSMGYTNVEGWAQYFREADAWALVLAGIGAVTAVVVRSRFGITVTAAGHRVRVGHRARPAGQPLQRPSPAPVVHLGLPHGRLGLRDRVHHRGGLAAVRPSLAGSRPAPGGEPRSEADPAGGGGPGRWDHPITPAPAPPRRWGPAAVSGAVLGLLA